jgi:hypothetical protein
MWAKTATDIASKGLKRSHFKYHWTAPAASFQPQSFLMIDMQLKAHALYTVRQGAKIELCVCVCVCVCPSRPLPYSFAY